CRRFERHPVDTGKVFFGTDVLTRWANGALLERRGAQSVSCFDRRWIFGKGKSSQRQQSLPAIFSRREVRHLQQRESGTAKGQIRGGSRSREWRRGDDEFSHGAGDGHDAAAVVAGRTCALFEPDAPRRGEYLEDGYSGRLDDSGDKFPFGLDRILRVV